MLGEDVAAAETVGADTGRRKMLSQNTGECKASESRAQTSHFTPLKDLTKEKTQKSSCGPQRQEQQPVVGTSYGPQLPDHHFFCRMSHQL